MGMDAWVSIDGCRHDFYKCRVSHEDYYEGNRTIKIEIKAESFVQNNTHLINI